MALLCLAQAASAAAPRDRAVLVRLYVEDHFAGDAILLEDGGESWLSVEALEAAGYSVSGGHRRTIDGAASVSLRSLPIAFKLHEDRLILQIVAKKPPPVSFDRVALVSVKVEGRAAGEAILVERGAEKWISRESVDALGLPTQGIRGVTVAGASYVELGSMRTKAEYDERTGVLSLTPPAAIVAKLEQVALYRIVVDGLVVGDGLLYKLGGERYVAAEALEGAGVRAVAGLRAQIEGLDCVAIAGPLFDLDDASQTLRISTRPAVAQLPDGFDQAAIYRLDVNGRERFDTLVLRRGTEVWVATEALEEAGIGRIGGERAFAQRVEHVRLGTLSPGIAYEIDEQGMKLELKVSPELLTSEELVALLELEVNGRPTGETKARLKGSSIRVPVSTLTRAGIVNARGMRTNVDGEEWVDLGSLTPDMSHRVDRGELTLALRAAPELFGSSVVAVASNRPRDLLYRQDGSAFLNYSVGARRDATEETGVDAFAETGLSAFGGALTSTFSRSAEGRLARHLSTVTWDDQKRLVRWTAGDRFSSGGPLGGGALLGGFALSREYSIDPYRVHSPTADFQGQAGTPSVVEIYVNDRLVRREEVPAGTFQLQDVLLESGQGDTRMVIRDAFGREREVRDGYYSGVGLLDKGMQEYSYAVGLVRKAPKPVVVPGEFDPGEYGDPALTAAHRYGLTRWLTASGGAEASVDLASASAGLSLALPVGQLGLAAGGSSDRGLTGGAASGGWSFSGRRFGLGASARAMSEDYATLSLRSERDRPLLDGRAFASARLGRFSLAVQHSEAQSRDLGRSRRTSANGSFTLGRGHLFLSAGTTESASQPRALDFFAGFSASLGRGRMASVGHSKSAIGETSDVTVAQSMPAGSGVGYRFTVRDELRNPDRVPALGVQGGPQSALGAMQYQGRYGRVELGGVAAGESWTGTARVSGGVVAVGGSVFASRPVEQGFALVQVPGVSGVRVLAHNQEVGRTNKKGNLLVPNMIAYYGNRLSIADEDVPLNYAIAQTDLTVATPNRGAAVVRFPVRRIQAVQAKVLLREGAKYVVPAYGEVKIQKKDREWISPIGKGGELYFEDLPPGRYDAKLRWRGKTAKVVVTVPRGVEAPIIDLGRLTAVGQ